MATAGDAIESFPAPVLEPSEEKRLDFSARVIGRNYSFRSENIKVIRPEGLGGGDELLYSQVQQNPQIQ